MTPEEVQILRSWVEATAYAEDDFVLNGAREIRELLDALDPDWRKVFNDK